MHITPRFLFCLSVLFLIITSAVAEEPGSPEGETTPAPSERIAIKNYTHAPYPLVKCPVSGQPLGSMGDPYIVTVDDQEVRLCCAGCEDKLRVDSELYLKKIRTAVIKQQKASYPLKTCLIDREESLGDDPVDYVWRNRLVRFCCPPCIEEFEADPVSNIEYLNQAVIEAQSEAYPLDTCVVSGDELADVSVPILHVVGDRLVKLCCEGCIEDIKADPAKYLAKVRQAKGNKTDDETNTEETSHDGHEH